ncbi:MAG: protein kinase [Gemmataceae bacterium]
MAQISIDEARSLAAQVVQQAVPPESPPEESARLALYLSAVPDAVRPVAQTPRRSDWRHGAPAFVLKSGDDVVKLLPQRPPRFQPGDELPGKPGWVVERLLGVGGFGEVWFARHGQEQSETGAVKFCLGESARSLIHEAGLIERIMQRGTHPNLVPLVDMHLDGPTPWIMFEYVNGGNLTDWIHQLARKPAAKRVPQVLAALRQLTSAVALFHGLTPPIVHRDLKPSNILLDPASKLLRITDFGIGGLAAQDTLRNESRGHTTSGGRLQSYLRGSHTPLYASPQQRTGADADPRDDVHALGVIAYQMLTGHLTQGAGPDFAEDLRESGAEESLIELLGRCVAQKPDRRPKDARDLSERLANLRMPKRVVPLSNPSPTTKSALFLQQRQNPSPPDQGASDLIPMKHTLLPLVPHTLPTIEPTPSSATLPSDHIPTKHVHLPLVPHAHPQVEPTPFPATPAVEWAINIHGTWSCKHPGQQWQKICQTPSRVTLVPAETYQLTIRDTSTSSDLQHLPLLQGLTQLQSLNLEGCRRISDVGLAFLRGLTQLRSLDLNDCYGITNTGITHLRSLNQLQSLNLKNCYLITDAGLAHLKGLTQLQSLNLYGCNQITNTGLAYLKSLTQLQSLNLYGCNQITDTGLTHLKSLTQLQSLNLGGCEQITDGGLAHLKGLTQLQSLNLDGCKQITDGGLAHLKSLTQLQSLELGWCKKITDAGLASLQRALPKCSISISL